MRGAGTAQAERLKMAKYEHLDSSQFFVPFAVETSGVLGEAAEEFVGELGRRFCKTTREPAVTSTFCNAFQSPCRGEMQQQSLAPWGGHSWTAGSDFCMLIHLHDYII